jgi:hypothetical protein
LGEPLTANDFLQQLEYECKIKNGGKGQRSIGFF